MKRRLLGFLVCACLGLVLGTVAYAALIGVPFGPKVKGDIELAQSDRPGQRVLFVGNSLTYWNDMPSMVRELAEGDPEGPTLLVVQYTAPGWDLRRASRDKGLRALLEGVAWDDVVLQERSDVHPPFFETLQRRVAERRARTTIFGLWGEADYAEAAAYADTLPAFVAPVGMATEAAYRAQRGVDLDDGTGHPNRAGSFLIACVFYLALTELDPAQSAYTAGLDPGQASFLKSVAWDVYRDVTDT